MSSWRIRYAEEVVRRDIPALDAAVKKRIRAAIESKLATDPLRFGKPLRYSLSHQRALRVGDYRILYALDHEKRVVSVTAIGHRREIYEG